MRNVLASASDRNLVEWVVAGNSLALGELARRYSEKALRVAYSITGDTRIAEDACQDAWICFMKSMDKFDIARPFFPWFKIIVKNRAFELIKPPSKKFVIVEYLDGTHASVSPRTPLDFELDDIERIRRALRRLSKIDQQILECSLIEGYPSKEIAVMMDMSDGMVRQQKYRALRRLRKLCDNDAQET